MVRNEIFSVPGKKRIDLSMTVGAEDGSGSRENQKKGSVVFRFHAPVRVINLLNLDAIVAGQLGRTPNQ